MANTFLARILLCTLLCIARFTATPANARVPKAASLRRDVDHLHFVPRDIIKTDAHRSLRSANGVKDRVKAAVANQAQRVVVNAVVAGTGIGQAARRGSNYMGGLASQAAKVKHVQRAKAALSNAGSHAAGWVGGKAHNFAERNKDHASANSWRGVAQRSASAAASRAGTTASNMNQAREDAEFKQGVAAAGEAGAKAELSPYRPRVTW